MKSFKISIIYILLTSHIVAQEKVKFTDRLYCADMSSTFHYVQGRISWMPSNLLCGMQYKRIKSDNEAGIFTFFTGQTFSLNYTKIDNHQLINSNLETHFRSYPITRGIIRIGAGIDYTTNFHQMNFFSIYPSIGLDIGGVEIIYAYLLNGYKSSVIADHRITLAFGLWVKSRKNDR